MFLVLLICLQLLVSSASCVQFSFAPSPNIHLQQTARYKCSVDGVDSSDTVSVQWKINGISSSNRNFFMSYITSIGVQITGIGTRNSTVTVPGVSSLNGTTVECLATGVLNGEQPYGNKSSSVLYIQGKPRNVGLVCQSYECQVLRCNWSVPYTLTGVDISQYAINITKGEEVIVQTTLNATEYQYNISNRLYNEVLVSVAATLGSDIEGEVDTEQLKLDQGCSSIVPTELNIRPITMTRNRDQPTKTSSVVFPTSTVVVPSDDTKLTSIVISLTFCIVVAAIVIVILVISVCACIRHPRFGINLEINHNTNKKNPSMSGNLSEDDNKSTTSRNEHRRISLTGFVELAYCQPPKSSSYDELFSKKEETDQVTNGVSNSSTLSKSTSEQNISSTRSPPMNYHINNVFSALFLKKTGSITHVLLIEHVAHVMPEKWKDFARALNIDDSILQTRITEDLRAADGENDSDFHKFCHVLHEWQISNVRPFTWETLVIVLNDIGRGDYVNELKEHLEKALLDSI